MQQYVRIKVINNVEAKNMIEKYKTVFEDGIGEIIEKKSRFIANVHHIESEEEAIAYIEMLRKQYWDARHNCYAYIIGKNSNLTRCSDDGEPSGTAGKPILEVMLNNDLTNAIIVVTRYFGGVLLGTGGLVRAYSQASINGIEQAKTGIMQLMNIILLKVDYGWESKISFSQIGSSNYK